MEWNGFESTRQVPNLLRYRRSTGFQCDSGYEPIRSPQECRAALIVFGFSPPVTFRNPTEPRGCYLLDLGLPGMKFAFFNPTGTMMGVLPGRQILCACAPIPLLPARRRINVSPNRISHPGSIPPDVFAEPSFLVTDPFVGGNPLAQCCRLPSVLLTISVVAPIRF